MAIVALSFDIEEFDVPIENGKDIDDSEQMRISVDGTKKILDILSLNGVTATFFCTAHFAEQAPELIRRMVAEGHEIASHGYYHSRFDVSHLVQSKHKLEEISGQKVSGYRMARMMPIDEAEVEKSGYTYNSSLNPTCIPGRYNNLAQPRVPFKKQGVLQIPASVLPLIPIPLFWLAVHLFPLALYKWMINRTLKHRGLLVVYCHPWEFYNLRSIKEQYGMSSIMVHNSGDVLKSRWCSIIKYLKNKNYKFVTMNQIKDEYIVGKGR